MTTTDDTGSAATTDAPRWYVLASLAWLWLVRHAMRCRVLSLRRALRLTEPWHVAASAAGLKLPARFYEVATEAGLELPDAPAPAQI